MKKKCCVCGDFFTASKFTPNVQILCASPECKSKHKRKLAGSESRGSKKACVICGLQFSCWTRLQLACSSKKCQRSLQDSRRRSRTGLILANSKCSICGRDFKTASKNRVTCGALRCRRQSAIRRSRLLSGWIAKERRCESCGRSFHPRHRAHICCSKVCMNKCQALRGYLSRGWHPMMMRCPFCAKEFMPDTRRRVTCGALECKSALSRQRAGVEKRGKKGICRFCGKDFLARNRRQITCGNTPCRRKLDAKAQLFNCSICGRAFWTSRHDRITCGDPKCQKEHCLARHRNRDPIIRMKLTPQDLERRRQKAYDKYHAKHDRAKMDELRRMKLILKGALTNA
jgi:hypothetical protein